MMTSEDSLCKKATYAWYEMGKYNFFAERNKTRALELESDFMWGWFNMIPELDVLYGIKFHSLYERSFWNEEKEKFHVFLKRRQEEHNAGFIPLGIGDIFACMNTVYEDMRAEAREQSIEERLPVNYGIYAIAWRQLLNSVRNYEQMLNAIIDEDKTECEAVENVDALLELQKNNEELDFHFSVYEEPDEQERYVEKQCAKAFKRAREQLEGEKEEREWENKKRRLETIFNYWCEKCREEEAMRGKCENEEDEEDDEDGCYDDDDEDDGDDSDEN